MDTQLTHKMPHTTRKNYKAKLLQKDEVSLADSLSQVSAADKVYAFLDKESVSKTQLHRSLAEVADMAVDVVRKADEFNEVGGLRYAKAEELNDDRLKYFDSLTMLDRVFEILMISEERIETLSEALNEAVQSRGMVSKRLEHLLTKVAENERLQREVYDIGKEPSENEIAEFEEAEENGEKYIRTFADRSLQSKPTDNSLHEEEPELPPTPVQTPPKVAEKPKKPTARKH